MLKLDTLIVDGHGLNWQRLCELRRQQMETWRTAQAQQLTLFPARRLGGGLWEVRSTLRSRREARVLFGFMQAC